jgi:hypothetical protein
LLQFSGLEGFEALVDANKWNPLPPANALGHLLIFKDAVVSDQNDGKKGMTAAQFK